MRYSLIVVVLIAFFYLLFKVNRHNAHIVHFNDIDSFYPMLLAIIVAVAATFYASLQMFAPDLWEQFYYHPTLNPFSVPGLLSAFLVSFWLIIIVGVAVLDDIRGKLPFGETLLYLGGLLGVCAINYIVFSITTQWLIGYVLLVVYIIFAIKKYRNRDKKSI